MKKTFTLLLLLCFCGIAGAQTKVILSEDFSKFTAGTEEAPDTVAINSNDDYFQSPGYFQTSGWRWWGNLYQAGGIALLKKSTSLSTPEIDLDGYFEIKMRVKRVSPGKEWLDFAWDMPYAGASGSVEISDEWSEVKLSDIGWSGGLSRISMSASNSDILIDWIEVSLTSLSQPQLQAESNLKYDGFTASWNPVVGADEYIISGYAQKTVGEDSICVIADLNFDNIKDTGYTEDAPYVETSKRALIYLDNICDNDYAGWQIYAHVYIDGAIGLSGAFGPGNYGWLRSNSYDLSGIDGKVTMSLRMKAPLGHKINIDLLSRTNTALQDFYQVDGKRFAGTGEWETYEFTFSGGREKCLFDISYYGSTASDILLLDDIRIVQELPAGTVREHFFLNKAVKDTVQNVVIPTCFYGCPIKYMVAAKKYLPEAPQHCWPYILSDYSENRTLTLPGVPDGITATPSEQKAINAIYDLSGRKLTEKPQRGFYIQGGRKYIAR
ncbi:MAG: hypothetical protein IIV54_00285 [Bacteroidaceae bacterium]|nr:hypothetical protein [Bacteroidaceae bacterium]